MSTYCDGPYGREWPARLSKSGDKILCGRTDGRRWFCDGLIARYETEHGPGTIDADGEYHVIPRIGLAWGDTVIEPGLYGPSRRAAERAASGRPPTSRKSWEGKPLHLIPVVPEIPFRKRCPNRGCRAMAVVDDGVLVAPTGGVLASG